MLKLNLNKKEAAERVRFVMGTLCSIEAPGAPFAAVTAAFEEIERWERILSRFQEDSEVSELNRAAGRGPRRVSADLFVAVARALRYARETDGLFEPAAGWRGIELDAAVRDIALPEGASLDFGGFGKGFALDCAARVLKASGVGAALLNFGGQVLAVGAPEGSDGWLVSVPGAPGPLSLRDASVAVSADSERPGHIRSPLDGLPVRRLGSAAAVCATATEADAWSTPLFILGRSHPSFRGRSYFATGGRS